jgi:hypothetical protein
MSRPAPGQSSEEMKVCSALFTQQLICILCVGMLCCSSENGVLRRCAQGTSQSSELVCRCCGTQFRTQKDARQKTALAGPIHLRCIRDEKKQGAETGQKRAHSPSAEQQTLVRRRLEHSSLLDLKPHQFETFQSHGFLRLKGFALSRDIAWKIVAYRPRGGGEDIAGKVKQHAASTQPLAEALKEWNTLLHNITTALGIDSAALHMVDPKVLVAKVGHGLQSVHWDGARDESSRDKFSGILICSSGHNGTALPTFPADEHLSFSNDPTKMQDVAHLLDSEHYASEPVHAGDIIFFRQSTPHFGVKNESSKDDRVVLFSMLSKSQEPDQDANQTFPWGFIGQAYGWDSQRFAEALVEGREFSPLSRMEPAERAAARTCLQRRGLLHQYNGTAATP